jgi:hypothetical protein
VSGVRTLIRGITIAALALGAALLPACGGDEPPPATPARVRLAPPPPATLPEWTYWQPVDVPLLGGGGPPATLPIDPAQLTMTPAAEKRWSALPQEMRAAVLARGFAVAHATKPNLRLGDAYGELREARIPFVVTVDTLLFLTHVALARARADVDANVLVPSLASLLRRLDVRLAAESRGARADMQPAYVVARGVVEVALALAQPGYAPTPELEAVVDAERARVIAHTGVGVSPWLGVSLDYSAMVPRGLVDRDEGRAGWARAVTWLQQAALALEGSGERAVHVSADVATARAHARAALLLSRLVEHEVDAEASASWTRIERAAQLLVGEPDDITPRELTAAAVGVKLDLRNADWIADVVRVDRVRHAAARARVARVYDGGEGVRVPAAGIDPSQPIGRLSPSFRLLGPRATPDEAALQSLVFPLVGRLDRPTPPPTCRDGLRVLPTGLDVGSWLGSRDARDAEHESGDDAYAGYGGALDRLVATEPPEDSLARHRTPYLSMLDALETWLRPSAGDRVQPSSLSREWGRRKLEVALAAWTELRHDATALATAPLPSAELQPHQPPVDTGVPAFVEPHPEVIAKLLAIVRQTLDALDTEELLPKRSPARVVLGEVDDLLWLALGGAMRAANDDPLPPELASALAALPGRIRGLEAALADAGEADVPLAIDVHTDLQSGRALEETTGWVGEVWMVMREPGTRKLWLAVGASIPQHELVQPAGRRLTDGAWRAKLAAEGEPAPSPVTQPYVLSPR